MTQWRRLLWDDAEIPEARPEAPAHPEALVAWDRQLAETGQVVFGKQPFKVAILLLGLVAAALLVCPGLPIVARVVGGGWLVVFGSIAVPLQYRLVTSPGPPMTVTDEGLHLSLDQQEPITVSWAEVEGVELERAGRSRWIRICLTTSAEQRITGHRHVKKGAVYLPLFMRGRKTAIVDWLNLQVARRRDAAPNASP